MTPGLSADQSHARIKIGVITCQMLTGKLQYATQVPKAKTKQAQSRLRYGAVLGNRREIPVWIDEAIKKSVLPMPQKRYEDLTEFT